MEPMRLTVPEFRMYMERILEVASILAALTPTPKDDRAIRVMKLIVTNDEIMNAVAELLAKEDHLTFGVTV